VSAAKQFAGGYVGFSSWEDTFNPILERLQTLVVVSLTLMPVSPNRLVIESPWLQSTCECQRVSPHRDSISRGLAHPRDDRCTAAGRGAGGIQLS
jgi:hypothetical protein